ncbi:LamG domain-containing protein [Frankia sp. CNm7]|uniref:LamG domain-containing protein n=1 Tax=Frankia nepalensis TaxID=1836974 RepID=A0A937RQC9_9ACTN|nr:LamG domain-containing protein [Frankia nepalensis]MBL7498995.1 LamG domain-containing protein [Frankia nepalensis]MBL7511485.1 LamG domain-containing protein [Frankia nepalensis]MBL7520701.1 LamG domain-containing protein [Frankia nepalensis]MBL7630728.1 LamG domain-containing protein [Frankia nepalensis]
MTTPTAPAPANVPAALNVAAALAAAGFTPQVIANALLDASVYPSLTATELARVLCDRRVAPTLDAAALTAVLTGTNRYQPDAVRAAVDAVFPPPPVTAPPSNTAFAVSGAGYLAANPAAAYNFGAGDFTVEAALRATGPGTVVARKGTAGGAGNGGFLVVARPGGSLKFATDSGFGFFEITTPSSAVLDGQWHHVAAVRSGTSLVLYVDGQQVGATTNGNAAPPLNVNNSLSLTVGTTEQSQEQFRALTGQVAEVRLWNGARSATQIRQSMWTRVPAGTAGLVGRWSGEFGRPVDLSATRNATRIAGTVTTVAGPPAIAPTNPVSPYVGAYDLTVRGTAGAWSALGTLCLFPDGTTALNDRVVSGAVLRDTSLTWPADGAVAAGAGTVTFQPTGQDPRFWPTPQTAGPVLQGTYQPPGGAVTDVRGQRRP